MSICLEAGRARRWPSGGEGSNPRKKRRRWTRSRVKESIGTRYACTGGFGEVPSGFCAPSFEGVERLFVGSLGVAGSHAVEHQALDAGSGWVFFGAYERAAVPLRHAATASWSWTGTPGCCSANSTTRQLRDPDAERSQAMQAGVSAGADGNQ